MCGVGHGTRVPDPVPCLCPPPGTGSLLMFRMGFEGEKRGSVQPSGVLPPVLSDRQAGGRGSVAPAGTSRAGDPASSKGSLRWEMGRQRPGPGGEKAPAEGLQPQREEEQEAGVGQGPLLVKSDRRARRRLSGERGCAGKEVDGSGSGAIDTGVGRSGRAERDAGQETDEVRAVFAPDRRPHPAHSCVFASSFLRDWDQGGGKMGVGPSLQWNADVCFSLCVRP